VAEDVRFLRAEAPPAGAEPVMSLLQRAATQSMQRAISSMQRAIVWMISTSSQIWTSEQVGGSERNGAQHSRIGMPGKFEFVKPRRNIGSTAHS